MFERRKILEGKFTILKPISEEDFEHIIKWRNDPFLNRYLNQPFELSMTLQKKWYQEKYLQNEDILFVMIEKRTGKKFGTIGFNDIDSKESTAILGRLIIGEYEFKGTKEFIESIILVLDYSFFELKLEKLYGHCVKENKNMIAINSKLGFTPTKKTIYPQYCNVNGMELVEMINTKEKYIEKRKNLMKIIAYYSKR